MEGRRWRKILPAQKPLTGTLLGMIHRSCERKGDLVMSEMESTVPIVALQQFLGMGTLFVNK